jgi:hypothetical protein
MADCGFSGQKVRRSFLGRATVSTSTHRRAGALGWEAAAAAITTFLITLAIFLILICRVRRMANLRFFRSMRLRRF